MLLARARVRGRVVHGIVEDGALQLIRGGLFGRRERSGEVVPLEEAHLLAPTQPTKVLAIGLNYRSHLASGAATAAGARPEPAQPEPFIKTPSSVIGPGEAIVLPPGAGRVDEEGEVVAVIGRRGRNIPEERVEDYILGYTAATMSRRASGRATISSGGAPSPPTPSPPPGPGSPPTLIPRQSRSRCVSTARRSSGRRRPT